jgi:DNA-binding NarL/FixJ family response regulator
MVTIALFTDECVAAAGISGLLAESTGLSLVAICAEESLLTQYLERESVDILIVDMVLLPDLEMLNRIRRCAAGTKVVLWGRHVSDEFAYQVMSLGIRAILRKTLPSDMVVRCLMKVAQDEVWFDNRLTARYLTSKVVRLTRRESQLVNLLARGLRNKEIAAQLDLSEGTIKVYMSRLFTKLGVKDRFELALYGLKNLSPEAGSAAPGPVFEEIGGTRLNSIVLQKGALPSDHGSVSSSDLHH